MKKTKFIQVFNSLNQMGQMRGVKFAYAVNKNINLMTPDMDVIKKTGTDLDKLLNSNDKFQAFEKARIKLAESFAKKDKDGKAVKTNGNFIIEKLEDFEVAITKLKEQHKEAIDFKEAKMKEYNDLLDEEIKFEFHKIKLEDFPSDISSAQMNGIYDLVQE